MQRIININHSLKVLGITGLNFNQHVSPFLSLIRTPTRKIESFVNENTEYRFTTDCKISLSSRS